MAEINRNSRTIPECPSVNTELEEKFRRWIDTKEGRDEIYILHQKLQNTSKRVEKSEAVCVEFKTKGTEAFVDTRIEEAHRLYSLALQNAPLNSSSIPLLFGNRSAALYEMNLLQDCLIDIENALNAGFPQDLKCKLLTRKVRCLLHLFAKEEALATLEELKQTASKTGLMGIFEKLLSELLGECETLSTENDARNRLKGPISLPCLYDGESTRISNMSNSLEIRSNPEEGRHIVTKTGIPKGSVIAVEKPFAAVLLHQNALSHCQMCLKKTLTPLPCEWCCDVVFCSAACRVSALPFHSYECPIFETLSRFRIAHLALRLLLVASYETCRKIRNEANRRKSEHVETNICTTKEEQYRAVYSRVTHLDKLNPQEELNYATVAITLSEALMDQTTFIEETFLNSNQNVSHLNENEIAKDGIAFKSLINSQDFKSRLKIEISCLLMHHITLVISNGHGIDNYRRCPEDSDELSPVILEQIALAVYSSASLMNHSCKIYTINSFCDDILVTRNIEDLNPGDQVYTCYGPHFGEKPAFERQKKLEKQYFFKCKCIACTDSTFFKEESRWSGYQCSKCSETGLLRDSNGIVPDLNNISEADLEKSSFQCFFCPFEECSPQKLIKETIEVVNLRNEALDFLNEGKMSKARMSFENAMRRGALILDSRNEFLNTMRKSLSKTLAQCGEVESCLRELLLYLQYIKMRHGKESTTAAFEMIRILGIVKLWKNYGYDNLIETEDMEAEIKFIFTIHYGKTWRDFVKINEF